MKIEVWSDFACPFCYLGKKRLETAIKELKMENEVDVVFKSFQLDERATSHPDIDIHELIANKYGIPYEEAKASNGKIIQMAKDEGLAFDFEILKPNQTRWAHEVQKLAESNGIGDKSTNRLFKAYFEEGADLGDAKTLISLAVEIGLNGTVVTRMLEEETFEAEVKNDQRAARVLGIRSVPHFVFDDHRALSGAQPLEVFKQVLLELKKAD